MPLKSFVKDYTEEPDNGYLLTDRAFAGADTLATSYALATAIRKIGEYDIIVGVVRLLMVILHR